MSSYLILDIESARPRRKCAVISKNKVLICRSAKPVWKDEDEKEVNYEDKEKPQPIMSFDEES